MCLFFWFIGNELEPGTNKLREPQSGSRAICSTLRFILHEPRKSTHSLYWQWFQQRPFLKFSKKSDTFKILAVTGSTGHLISFGVLITVHVIFPTAGTTCWQCLLGIELKNFSRVQRRKYGTIVNISMTMTLNECSTSILQTKTHEWRFVMQDNFCQGIFIF